MKPSPGRAWRVTWIFCASLCLVGSMSCSPHGSTAPQSSSANDGSPAPADGPREDLVIHVSGFPSAPGEAVARLFRKGGSLFGAPYASAAGKVDQGKATLIFPRLQHGDYAVIVVHDQNGNGNLDHHPITGRPMEPVGFSNGFTRSAGLPNFESLRFTFGPGAQPVTLSVE